MNTITDYNNAITRRQFFRKNGTGLGVAALSSLLGSGRAFPDVMQEMMPHIAPKGKRAIYISLIGAPWGRAWCRAGRRGSWPPARRP